jgi:iron(II)-dependent oxidoreductase
MSTMSISRLWKRQPAEPPERTVVVNQDPLRAALELERYGVIVGNAEQWKDHPGFLSVYESVSELLDDQYALVPEGFVSMPDSVDDQPGSPETDFETGPFLISRYAVTNAQYQKFVDAGGYEELDFWPEAMWTQLIGFKDQTGRFGPRYWKHGICERGLEAHPVVGLSSYEAEAYANWAGFKLPSEAEWQMAASWRIRTSAHVFRRYPWGDAFDERRCNVWSSAIGATVPVQSYEGGAAPNGVHQLIGNVWEWTASDFELRDENQGQVLGDTLMKSIRGGAFDTYFPSQATSDFRTGLGCLARSRNVGFRLAMDAEPGAL